MACNARTRAHTHAHTSNERWRNAPTKSACVEPRPSTTPIDAFKSCMTKEPKICVASFTVMHVARTETAELDAAATAADSVAQLDEFDDERLPAAVGKKPTEAARAANNARSASTCATEQRLASSSSSRLKPPASVCASAKNMSSPSLSSWRCFAVAAVLAPPCDGVEKHKICELTNDV